MAANIISAAQSLIVEGKCKKLENYNELLKTFPGRMKASATTFREVINDSNVVGWTSDTAAGQQTRQNVIKNCDGIDQLADQLTALYQEVERLIAASRASNNRTSL